MTTPDSAVVTTSYEGNQATVTDQAGKKRSSLTDALGRLVAVEELYSDGSVYNETDYAYNPVDNLLTVEQGSQTRTFSYDMAGRLVSAANPESGTVQYQYDANGNLTQKQDARGIYTWYSYDDLNRIASRSYSDSTASVTYGYDGSASSNMIGRLALVSSSVSSYTYDAYDSMGRVLQSTQTTGSNPAYQMSYTYNLAGGLTSETYPSGRTVSTSFDTAGRVSQVTGQKTGESNKTYASTFSYWPHGAVESFELGNGRWEHTEFNSRLQPTVIGLGTSSTDSSILGLGFGYGTTDNNGNVLSHTIAVPGHTWTQTYQYDDPANRISYVEEEESVPVWSQTYSYDIYGNRAVTAGNKLDSILTPQSLSAFSTSTNRLVASQYDSAGNQTVDAASNSFSYDAENRQKSFNGSTAAYSYDGEGRRVSKTDSSGTTVYVYDALGRLIMEVCPQSQDEGTNYLTQDHLGSTRVVTDSTGAVVARHDYVPFGEEIPSSWGTRASVTGYGTSDSTRQRFTGKERDTESGLDYFGARYLSGAQGRFTSSDPLMGSGNKPANPLKSHLINHN